MLSLTTSFEEGVARHLDLLLARMRRSFPRAAAPRRSEFLFILLNMFKTHNTKNMIFITSVHLLRSVINMNTTIQMYAKVPTKHKKFGNIE